MIAMQGEPTDESVLYLGTQPVHLYRSEDRGESWEEIAAIQELPYAIRQRWCFPGRPAQDAGHVIQTAVHPEDANLLHLCLEHGGILRSFDRGKSWEDVSGGIDYLDIHFLRNQPGRRDCYFVATARGFYTADDPATGWVRAENGFTRDYFHDFVFLPPERTGENHTMVVAAADKSPGHWPATTVRRDGWDDSVPGARAAIFRSEDYGGSWYRATEGQEELDPMIWSLTTNPVDPDSLFGGLGKVSRGHVSGSCLGGSIIASGDRGVTWRTLSIKVPAVRKLVAQPEE
jgi:photosystem II stability/assembly factor-like uncharacterized protein